MKYRNVRDKKQRGKLHEQEAVGQRNATLEARWQRVVAIVRLSSLRRGVFGFFNHQLAEQGQKTSELFAYSLRIVDYVESDSNRR